MAMTVHEAAVRWGVNRRTILKWIMGKDATGRGKRLVEGTDYQVVDSDVPGRKMYMLLRDEYPLTLSTADIPKIERGRSAKAPAVEEPTGSQVEREIEAVVAPAPVEKPVRAPRAPRVEKPRRDRMNAEIDELVEEREVVAPPRPRTRLKPPPVEPPAPVEPTPAPAPTGTIREQIEAWVMANPKADDQDRESPVQAIARMIVPDVAVEAGERGSVSNLGNRNQDLIERAIDRVLATEPFTPDAKRFIGGKVLEYLQKYSRFQPGVSSRGYWPVTPMTLSGLRGFGAAAFEAPLPPYDWDLA